VNDLTIGSLEGFARFGRDEDLEEKEYWAVQPPPPGPLKPPECICEFKIDAQGSLLPGTENDNCPIHGPLYEQQRQVRAARKSSPSG
jgi:hypothetical protein